MPQKSLSQQAVRVAATICPRPLQIDLWPLILQVVSESRVTWATSMPILVFLGLSVLIRPDVRDRQTSDRQTSDAHHRLISPTLGVGHNNRLRYCSSPMSLNEVFIKRLSIALPGIETMKALLTYFVLQEVSSHWIGLIWLTVIWCMASELLFIHPSVQFDCVFVVRLVFLLCVS